MKFLVLLQLALLWWPTLAAPGSFTVSPSTAQLGAGITVTFETEDYTPYLFDIIAIYAAGETPSASLEAIVLTRSGGVWTNEVHLPVAGLTGAQVRIDDPNLIAGRDQTISELTVGNQYDIYYVHSTDGATWESTIFSGNRFTVIESPTGKPTAYPTLLPSGEPTGMPTTPSAQPSSTPTFDPSYLVVTQYPVHSPTDAPTSLPSGSPTLTISPTLEIQRITVVGNITTLDRGASDYCKDTALQLYLRFDKKIEEGQSIYIDMPGFTNGPCSSPENGFDFEMKAFRNMSAIRMIWYEGNYTNMFRDSKLRIITEDHALDNDEDHDHDGYIIIDIDRSNSLKFSCISDSNFQVQVREIDSTNYYTSLGSVTFTSFNQSLCYSYNTSLEVFPSQPQTHTEINLTMRLALDLKSGDNITLRLPGFTRSGGFVADATDPNKLIWGRTTATDGWLKNVTGGMLKKSGPARSHFGTDWSIGVYSSSHMFKRWYAYWTEGVYNSDYESMYSGSQVVFSINPNSGPDGYTVKAGGSDQETEDILIKAGDTFSIVIDSLNGLSTYCGRPANYSGFEVQVSSAYSDKTIAFETVRHSPMIGSGCPVGLSYYNVKEMCSGRGSCNFCTGRCECYDGSGSSADKASVEVDNFKRDCSSKICPFGTSFGVLTGAADDFNSHPKTECSSAGKCDRERGECRCFEGFTGSACQRKTCSNDCSGRGQCVDMSRLANWKEAQPLSLMDNYTWYNPYSSASGTWDSRSMFGCVCDSGWAVGLGANETQLAEFFGPSCEHRRCPSGDNPTTGDVDETDCEGKSQTGGTYVSYFGKTFTISAGVGATGNKCHHECSGQGTCDYSTGLCHCYPGMEGHNCGLFAGTELSDEEKNARRNKYEGLHALRYQRRNIYGTP